MSESPLESTQFNSDHVEGETLCRKCGYNLFGLLLDGKCPECGAAVRLSLRGDLLRYSKSNYVQRLARGIQFILWGVLIVILFVPVALLMDSTGVGERFVLYQAVRILAVLPAWIGVWLVTTPDASGSGEDRYGLARKIVRIFLIANALYDFAILTGGPPASPAFAEISLIVAMCITCVREFALLVYLAQLALRIPDDELSARARLVRWSAAGVLGAIFAFQFLTAHAENSRSILIVDIVTFVGAIAFLVLFVMYVAMLFRFGAHFKRQAAISRLSEPWPQLQEVKHR